MLDDEEVGEKADDEADKVDDELEQLVVLVLVLQLHIEVDDDEVVFDAEVEHRDVSE